jgi:hypothetical protein
MRIAVVAVAQQFAPPSGVALSLARALRRANPDCTLVWAFPEVPPSDAQADVAGVDIVYVTPFLDPSWPSPDQRFVRLAVNLAPILRRFEIIYSVLWGHPALHLIKESSFTSSRLPFIVSVVGELQREESPGSPEEEDATDPGRRSGEQFQMEHSDYIVCMDGTCAEKMRSREWRVPAPDRISTISDDPADWQTIYRKTVARASARDLRRTAAEGPASSSGGHKRSG